MEIEIRNSEEFHRLLSALVDEIVDAHIHYKLYQDLTSARKEYSREFSQSWTFWSLTLEAHLDIVLGRLCKAFDQYASRKHRPVNLRNLLHTIEANLHLFDQPNFRERLKGNPFVDSLAVNPRRPDSNLLRLDLEAVSESDPLVQKLGVWRDNYIAHHSSERALDPKAFESRNPLTFEEISALLDRGLEIVNRYSYLFIATTHSTHMVGSDDFLNVLNSVRADLEADDARFAEEVRAADERASGKY